MHCLTELLEKTNTHDYNQTGMHETMLSVARFIKKLTNKKNTKILKLKCLYSKKEFFFIIDSYNDDHKTVVVRIRINFKSVYFIPTGFDDILE